MWWKSAMPKHLPLALGPWAPASMDVMSGFGRDSSFYRLYYPSAFTSKENNAAKWFKWSPHDKYIEGFAQLINSWGTVIKMVIWMNGGEPMVPAMWEALPLKNGKKLPVIVFSHGFGATRFISSTIGMELASWGYLVACIEHRESSASSTYYYESAEHRDRDQRTWIPHKKMEFGPDHYAVRNEQLHKRVGEIKKLITELEELNNGKATNILQSSLDMKHFQGTLDMSSLCLMGHSFGGATSLLTMANDDRPSCGVILDGWMFPLKEENIQIAKPLIFINTQTFHIESNIHSINKIVENNNGAEREVYTIMHTTHETQTDTPHIMGYWLNWFMTKLDPDVGTKINNHLTLIFLHQHLGIPPSVADSKLYLEQYKKDFIKGTYVYSKMPRRKL
ncbi:hypothetical protein O3M35_009365 [Rhynocoris fuscipes]|uniref:1-alkyl-2-acetylglycerophosphocholine esterase n=1 Tax=Rhynocoris fuscipes TaxID=488301 RepID=A0AAW1D5L3_9HEMI